MPIKALQILFAIIFLFITSSHAQVKLSDIGLSPASIALTLGQWLMKDEVKVYYLRVESSGIDKESAKNAAFKYAVEKAIGTLVLTETKVSNKEVTKNEILKYSSGFINDFNIINETIKNNKIFLTLDIWVSESKIADRILITSKEEGLIDGARIAAQLSTIKEETKSASSILKLILKDYPKNAFTLKIGKSQSQIQGEKVILKIPVDISWNQKYLESIFEALKITTGPSKFANTKIHYRIKGAWTREIAYYKDNSMGNIFETNLIESIPELKMIYKNKNNESIAFDCLQIIPLTGIYFGPSSAALFGRDNAANPTGQFIAILEKYKEYYIDGDYEATLNVFVNVTNNSNIISQIHKVEAEITKRKECTAATYVADPLSLIN